MGVHFGCFGTFKPNGLMPNHPANRLENPTMNFEVLRLSGRLAAPPQDPPASSFSARVHPTNAKLKISAFGNKGSIPFIRFSF
jgi:hypothetical protein